MIETTELAYAKLNISLDVSARRADGYHDMVMVMQTVSLSDEIRIQPNASGRVIASSNLPFIPRDERNLAVRAALRYLERIGKEGQGFRLDLRKNIPVGAGMAGGSSDAAAVLRGLNRMYGPKAGARCWSRCPGSPPAPSPSSNPSFPFPLPISSSAWTAARPGATRIPQACWRLSRPGI